MLQVKYLLLQSPVLIKAHQCTGVPKLSPTWEKKSIKLAVWIKVMHDRVYLLVKDNTKSKNEKLKPLSIRVDA